MHNTWLRFGWRAGLILVGASGLAWWLGGERLPYAYAETLGYVIILLALSLVYLGVRTYRDVDCHGTITFGRALRAGLSISLIPAVLYVGYNVLFFWLNGEAFYAYVDREMRASLPPADYARYVQDFTANRELYLNPLVQGALVGATVLVVGAVVALVSAALLSRKPAITAT